MIRARAPEAFENETHGGNNAHAKWKQMLRTRQDRENKNQLLLPVTMRKQKERKIKKRR